MGEFNQHERLGPPILPRDPTESAQGLAGEGDDQIPFYKPQPLSEEPPTDAIALAMKAVERRLAFYLGAGLSMSPPTELPRGSEVQQRIAERARRLLGVEVKEPEGLEPTLEEIGDAARQKGLQVLDQLRRQAADAIDFRNALPNYGHEAVALLLREGAVEVLSVNWDCAVESAGRNLGFEITRILRQEERANRPSGPILDKLNGCASQPTTLRITQAEVDEPQAWVAHRVGSVLTDTTVVFIGLGTVGRYVADGVERVLAEAGDRNVPIIVVSSSLSDDWKQALADKADDAHASKRAEPFLDDLLRAAVRLALTRALARARRIADDGHPAGDRLVNGAERLYDALLQHPAVAVWRWWRDGAHGQSIGQPFILAHPGETALATICALVGTEELTVAGRDDALIVELPDRYLEICSWPGESGKSVVTRQADRIRRRRRRNVYRDTEKRIVSVAVGHDGPLPTAPTIIDISDPGGPMDDVVDGSERVVLEWVPAESFVQGTVAVS